MEDTVTTATPDDPGRSTAKRGRKSAPSKTRKRRPAPASAPSQESIPGSRPAPRRPSWDSAAPASKPSSAPSGPDKTAQAAVDPTPNSETDEPARHEVSDPVVNGELRRSLFEQLVARANEGNPVAMAKLRDVLDHFPDVWMTYGDLTKQVVKKYIDLVSQDDRLIAESIRRQLAYLKSQHAGNSPTPIEQAVIDQILVSWLAVRHAEMQVAEPGSGPLASARQRRVESANKVHLAAIRELVQVRKMLGLSNKPKSKEVGPTRPATAPGAEQSTDGAVDERVQRLWDSPPSTTTLHDIT